MTTDHLWQPIVMLLNLTKKNKTQGMLSFSVARREIYKYHRKKVTC